MRLAGAWNSTILTDFWRSCQKDRESDLKIVLGIQISVLFRGISVRYLKKSSECAKWSKHMMLMPWRIEFSGAIVISTKWQLDCGVKIGMRCQLQLILLSSGHELARGYNENMRAILDVWNKILPWCWPITIPDDLELNTTIEPVCLSKAKLK